MNERQCRHGRITKMGPAGQFCAECGEPVTVVADSALAPEQFARVCSRCGLPEPFPAWHYRSECTNAPVVTRAEYDSRRWGSEGSEG